MCKTLDVDPSNAIYIDDTVDGTSAAKSAGLISVGFGNKTGYNSEDRLSSAASFIIHELSELLELVERLDIKR